MRYISLIISILILPNCSFHKNTKHHDPVNKLNKADYYSFLKEQSKKIIKLKKKNKIIKKELPAQFKTLVTINTNEDIAIKEILLAIAQQASIDIIIDPTVKGNATINARKQSAINLIKQVCASNKLRYTIKDNILNISLDKEYLQHYNLQFLSLKRSNKNRFSIATDILSTSDSKSLDNGSNTTLTASTEMDFWTELENNLKTLINSDKKNTQYFTINKQAGIISVYTNQAKQIEVKKYLNIVKNSIDKQVLIEAKIVEVQLKDEFSTGIEWDSLRNSLIFKMTLGLVPNAQKSPNILSLGHKSESLKTALNILNHFGTIRTLSNPRLTVLNNNSSVLKVAKNKVYFKIQKTKDYKKVAGTTDVTQDESISSEIKTVPVGFMMYVHPIIRDDGKIIMAIRPTISKVIQQRLDPLASEANVQQSYIPEIQVRELDSILSMESGETIIVGGLMEDNATNDSSGSEDVAKIPFLGNLFKSKKNERVVTELVIFIKATIIENNSDEIIYSESNVSSSDKNIAENIKKNS